MALATANWSGPSWPGSRAGWSSSSVTSGRSRCRRAAGSRWSSIPLQRPPLPEVDVPDAQDHHEGEHLEEEHAPKLAELLERDGPRQQEDRLDVEDDEQHGHEVELHRESLARVSDDRDARFVGGLLDGG